MANIEGKPMMLIDCIKEINLKIGRLASILRDAPKKPDDDNIIEDILTFTPEEWNTIDLIIKHYSLSMRKLNDAKAKGHDAITEWVTENLSLMGCIRDMVSSWYDRLHERSDA